VGYYSGSADPDYLTAPFMQQHHPLEITLQINYITLIGTFSDIPQQDKPFEKPAYPYRMP
jgi:hypothetical protein